MRIDFNTDTGRLCYAAGPMPASLRRDPICILSVACFLCIAGVYLIASSSDPLKAFLATWSDVPTMGLALYAAWRAVGRESTVAGRRFRTLIAAGLSSWGAVVLLNVSVPESSWSGGLVLVTDCAFLLFYLAFILASDLRAHAAAETEPVSWRVAVEWAGAAVFAFGLLAYFILIPARVIPSVYATSVPSLALFVTLDVVLLARFGWLVRTAGRGPWRVIYATVVASFAITLVSDGIEWFSYFRGVKPQSGDISDIVWAAQFVLYVIVARLPGGPPDEVGSRHNLHLSGDDSDRLRGRNILASLLPYAFALPVLHLAGRLAGLLDPAADRYREAVVLGSMLVLGALAIGHHLLLDRRYREVRTDLNVARDQLQQSRKMEALGRLAGGVAHDFNNLLSVILGYAELLMGQRTLDEGVSDAVEQIRQAGERAAAVTRQLTIFSQRQANRGRLLDLDRAIAGSEPLLRRLAGSHVTVKVVPGAPDAWLMADPNQLERALINLAANAKEAMPEGGVLTIMTRAVEIGAGGSERIGTAPPGSYVEIRVADTGTGMDDEVQAHLFEPFFTTRSRDQHRGLGLSLVYGIAMRSEGHVHVESEKGRGTTVHLLFPRRDAPTAVEPLRPAAAVERSATVLLAEDERGLRRLIKSCLERDGFVVLEAADGRAALDMAARHDGRIDVLLTDVVMPGLNGRELAIRLLPERPEMRVLFISGYAPDTLGDLKVADADPVLLQKPFAMRDLVEVVRQLVSAPGAGFGGPEPDDGAAQVEAVTGAE
ncbi:MAG TPA: ATP-binding protein [Vicinamibacterales bacterium]|jgi:signal transduction histidine kinase